MESSSRRRLLRGGMALAGLGVLSACGVAPLAAPQKRVARVGLLKQPPVDYVDVFRDAMRELGYVEGTDWVLDYRLIERVDQLPERAAEMARAQVDVIVAPNTAAVDAARKASPTTPIVIVNITDPIAAGFTTSLNRPDGTVTGTTLASRGVAGKRLQLLKQVTPGMTRVGVMWVPSSVLSESQWRETIDAAESLGLEVVSLAVEQPADFPAALELAVEQRAEALFLPIHQVVMAQLGQIASFALAHQLPSMAFQREYVDQGGLMSYGASVPAMYHRAAYFVDRLLKGARVADLPVELPTTWDFIINSRTALAMGLRIPDSVWSQATEILS